MRLVGLGGAGPSCHQLGACWRFWFAPVFCCGRIPNATKNLVDEMGATGERGEEGGGGSARDE